jgi:DNA polymerase elongation subunit (family B)
LKFYTNITRMSNTICFRGYENGQRLAYKEQFKPTLFISKGTSNSEWKTLEGKRLSPIQFDTMREAADFGDRYSEVESMKVYGNHNFVAQFIQENFPNDIEFDPSLVKVANIDIEVASDDGFPHPDRADAVVQSICLKYFGSPTIYIWALEDKYDPAKTELDVDPEDIYFVKCGGEVDLLLKFISFWSSQDTNPDIVTGWNVKGFDIPYLVNRTIKTIGEESARKFSPWGIVRNKTVTGKNGQKNSVYDLGGIEQLDYLDLFYKFGYLSYGVLESYKLDHVAFTVLNEKKLSYEEHGNLFTLYKEDYQKFIDYNIKDVLLVEQIDEKMGLVELAMTIAYKGGCNYQEAYGTTQLWDTYIYRELCRQKNVVPPKIERPVTDIAGGYVKTPVVGRHSWVVSFDLNSLYPHIFMQLNVSPETQIEGATSGVNVDNFLDETVPPSSKPEHCMAANGIHFRKDERGVIPRIIDGLYAERSAVKKEMLDTKSQVEKGVVNRKLADKAITKLNTTQMAIKIMMNSLYGAFGNRWFRYYDARVAEAITLTGQLAIRWAEKTVNDYMNSLLGTDDDYVIAIDTDSVYINFGPMVEKMGIEDKAKAVSVLNEIAEKKFEPVLQESYERMAKNMNAYENKMVMGREVIADVGVWTAKKRYILNVHDNEGVRYATPQLKIMGIEAVKSSTPASCRDALKGLFKVMMTQTEKDTQKAIQIFRNHFNTLDAPDIAFPRGVSDVDKWSDRDTIYKQACPIHVRGALLYNSIIRELKLEKKYDLIKNGEKIKFVYLNPKNPIRENVIAFPDYLPKEFGLEKYLDHDKMFEKAFLNVVTPVLDAMRWKAEETVSLEDFFG